MLKVNNFNDIAKDGLDQWVYFLKHEFIKPEFTAKGLAEAQERLDVLKLNDQERSDYEYWQLELHQRASMLETYEHIREEKLEEVRKEAEKQAKLAIAKNLLHAGMDIATIAQLTGATMEEIREIGTP